MSRGGRAEHGPASVIAANNVIAVTRIEVAKAEHQRCVKIVNDMNPEVARALGVDAVVEGGVLRAGDRWGRLGSRRP